MTRSTVARGRVAEILLVEDDPGDTRLIRRALSQGKLALGLEHVEDGEEALAYLRQEPPYADAPRPDLVLLDLNMPKKDGRAVLTEIRADPRLDTIPVVILTTSRAEEDVFRGYKLHANAYIAKPLDLAEFGRIVEAIETFWFSIVILPPRRVA